MPGESHGQRSGGLQSTGSQRVGLKPLGRHAPPLGTKRDLPLHPAGLMGLKATESPWRRPLQGLVPSLCSCAALFASPRPHGCLGSGDVGPNTAPSQLPSSCFFPHSHFCAQKGPPLGNQLSRARRAAVKTASQQPGKLPHLAQQGSSEPGKGAH